MSRAQDSVGREINGMVIGRPDSTVFIASPPHDPADAGLVDRADLERRRPNSSRGMGHRA